MDSANILSILSSLGQPQPAPAGMNVLQAIAPPVAPQAPPPPPPTAAVEPKPDGHPRKRLSVIDTIGRLADVFAKVGGAEALYQPTLDSRQDRQFGIEDRDRKIDADTIALATNKFDLGDKRNIRIGQTARGLKAIGEKGGDIVQAWPILAARMEIDPATIESVGQALAADPNALDGLIAATTDPKFDQAKYGGSVVYGTDAEGNLVAYQPGLGNNDGRNILPEGVTPIDPLKFVDTGGAQVGFGTRSGRTEKILPKSARPDTIVQAGVSTGNNKRTNATNIQIAGMPARAKAGEGSGGSNAKFTETAQGNLDELRQIYGTLNKMGAMVSPAQAANKNVAARIRASGIGQVLEGAVGTEAQTQRDRVASIRPSLMQSLAKATGMTGRQLDSNADVKLFMQTVTNPAASYEANIKAIDGLERFLKANAKKAETPAPAKARPKAQSGWSVVKVQ